MAYRLTDWDPILYPSHFRLAHRLQRRSSSKQAAPASGPQGGAASRRSEARGQMPTALPSTRRFVVKT